MPAISVMEEKSEPDAAAAVTVVTVVRNCAGSILTTMRSVAAQRGVRIEYIVIDGASTDGTARLIRSFSPAPDIFISEPDGGIYPAMNKAVRLASGRYVIFMNAGDSFASDTAVADLLKAARGSDIVYGDILAGRGSEWSDLRVASEPRNCHRIWFCHQAAMVSRELLLRFGFDERYRLSADFNFFKKCLRAGCSFRHLHEVVACFDTAGASASGRMRGLREDLAIVRENDSGVDRLKFEVKLRFQIFMQHLRNVVCR